MVFMEMFIGKFLLLLHCSRMEQELKMEKEQDFVEKNRYIMMGVAMAIGSFIFMAMV